MKKKFGVWSLIGVGILLTLFFGMRLVRAIKHLGGPPRPQPMATVTDVGLVREWMTIPYIAHTYGVPDEYLFDALEIDEKENRRKSLEQIDEEYFPESGAFAEERIKEAILAFQSHAPLPPLPPTPPAVPELPSTAAP